MAPPLWVKSNASFLAGASHPEELVETAAAQGHTAMALTDRHGVYGVVRAHMAAKACGIKLLVGCEIEVAGQGPLLLLAPNQTAYGQMCQLLSVLQLQQPKAAARQVAAQTLCTWLATFCGQANGPLALCPSPELLGRLAPLFACNQRLYALATRHGRVQDAAREYALLRAATQHGLAVVAASEVLYHEPARRALLDVLHCIQKRRQLAALGQHLRANASFALPAPATLARRFADRPAWLAAAHAVADRCQFRLETLRYRYPKRSSTPMDADAQLTARAYAGARSRYGSPLPAQVVAQLDEELHIVAELQYADYFLSMQDIVRWCQQQNILCQGRGSAANSVICYSLGITAIDPIRMQLLFSRFLSKARAEPPDIDLDIEHHRREEVIQWLYNDHGRRHAAMVANVVRFRWRTAIYEVGLALGLPAAPLRELGRRMGQGYEIVQGGFAAGGDVASWVAQVGLAEHGAAAQHLLRLSAQLRTFPRHLSVHPGGFVLGQQPVDSLCVIEPASMPGRTVLQWDKRDIDDVGLFKVDLLGLGALHHIHQTFDLVARHEGRHYSLASLPTADAKTYDLLCAADTVGVFQVESRAQMGMLPRLRPRQFYDLVVQVAIVRPGPIQGNMVHPYLRQRESSAPVQFPHPSFQEVLQKTYGVPIFQEQVMKLAMLAAGYDADAADALRRDMVAWRSHERLEQHHQKITQGMRAQGIAADFAERLFAQIRGFGAYGFPESHAASFAHLVYVTAYLRRHHLAAFTCALLNAQPMGFYSPATIVSDAQRHGIVFAGIDVQHSGWDCSLEPHGSGFAVRMGLKYLRGFGRREQALLLAAPPPYASLRTFVHQSGLSERACETLLQAGALDSFAAPASKANKDHRHHRRRGLWWQLRALLAQRADDLPWRTEPRPADPPLPQPLAVPLTQPEAVLWERESSHHSVRGHPVAALRARLGRAGVLAASHLNALQDGTQACHAGLMICYQRPETARGVTFVTLEDETGFVNVVLFARQSAQFAEVLRQPFFAVSGTVQVRHGSAHLLAERVFVPQNTGHFAHA